MANFQVIEVDSPTHSCGLSSGGCNCPETGTVVAVDCLTMVVWSSPFYGGQDAFTFRDEGRVIEADTSGMSSWSVQM